MASLDRNLRKDLEKTVKSARRVAEAGARKVVAQLGVGEAEALKHLTADQRELRNRLRAHGRQLGDRRDAKTGVQDTARLVQECAYEHWHRMLFARFLAETDLLIEPDSGVAITLDEVQELAREKATDWLELASDYAERMLPQIFRKDDPVLQIALPPETRSEMEDLLQRLSKPVFETDDSLGWVYQFWQSDKKDEVNKSEVKIGADELPVVTQLFTEDYMVLFLLHNTLGAWWAGKVLAANPTLAASALDEAALRAACKVGDIEWTYLRFVRDTAEDGAEGPWRPAAGVFAGWPKTAKDVTVLDPCMGSGHFLVFALPILVAVRMAEEGLSQSSAVDAVLKDNLFGLEIDPRCTQIAAFNLAFAAWRKVGHRPLPQLNLACSGLTIGVTKAEWLKLAEKAVSAADPSAKRDLLGVEQNLLTAGLEERVKNGLEALYDLFAKAPWLGSLIDPRRAGADILREGFDKLQPLLGSILAASDTDDAREMVVAAQGMAKAAELLGRTFTLCVTNVPFLGIREMSSDLRAYVDVHHNSERGDLGYCLWRRLERLARSHGAIAVVTLQHWLSLTSYSKLREFLLEQFHIASITHLGTGAFETITGAKVNVTLTISQANLSPMAQTMSLIDASSPATPSMKVDEIKTGTIIRVAQRIQFDNPQHRISFKPVAGVKRLGDYADCLAGIMNGDSPKFIRQFWEIKNKNELWAFLQSSPKAEASISGFEQVILYDEDNGHLREDKTVRREKLHDSDQRGNAAWGRKGVAVGQMAHLPATMFYGNKYDSNVAVIVPREKDDLEAICAFCFSDDFTEAVRAIDKKLNVTNATFGKVPFDIAHWRVAARSQFPNGLSCPRISDPTQWLFDGNPVGSIEPLQVGTVRVVGYSWPRQTGSTFIDYAALDADKLNSLADADGIVSLTALKGEQPGEQRLNALLSEAFGAEWSATKLSTLLTVADFSGKSLDDWLRDGFFAQHCELFHHRPFIWHVWDGRRDGFHALVNYHRLAASNGEGRRTLEKLIYSYIGDWIDRQRADQKAGIEGADARLTHAEHLKAELIKILEGEPPYDIFVRWKPLHRQPLGWDPDINDGVRINIRPFMTARPLNARGANSSILRARPRIRWDKDRGKEPTRDKADYPWFWGWDEASADFAGGATFDGNRWNDLHYTRAVKQAARDRHVARAGGKK